MHLIFPKVFDFLLALGISTTILLSTSSSIIEASASPSGTLLKTIVHHMGQDSGITDDQYKKYFKEGNTESGLKAVLAKGAFHINGYAIPATATEYSRHTPDGYTVNQTAWLYQKDGSWHGGIGGEKKYSSYAAAAFATATAIPAGLEIKLYDTNQDGYTDAIDAQYLEALIVDQITDNGNGTCTVQRGTLDPTLPPSAADGKAFDGIHFSPAAKDLIQKAALDPTIHTGDIALFWYEKDGWTMKRATEVHGFLINGRDHAYYQINETKYQDAMRFARDNLPISNRPGEFLNAQKFFNFPQSHKQAVSLWLVPTTDAPHTQGAPIGFTTGQNAREFLVQAIKIAQARLNSVRACSTPSELAPETAWVTPAEYNELQQAIQRAQTALHSNESPMQLDYQVYLLYLTLNGSKDDIGAAFAGYNYTGFQQQIQKKK